MGPTPRGRGAGRRPVLWPAARRSWSRGGDRGIPRCRHPCRAARGPGSLPRCARSAHPRLLALSRGGARSGWRAPALGSGRGRAGGATVNTLGIDVTPPDPRCYPPLAAVGLSPDPFDPIQDRACKLVDLYTLHVAIDLLRELAEPAELARGASAEELLAKGGYVAAFQPALGW